MAKKSTYIVKDVKVLNAGVPAGVGLGGGTVVLLHLGGCGVMSEQGNPSVALMDPCAYFFLDLEARPLSRWKWYER